MRHAFTLVELLVVIAVIAVLSVVVILILNPAETLRQSRDSNRVSDLSTLKTAIAFYEAQGGSSLGNASTSYVSIFDPAATSSAGDQCQGLGLPSLPGSWTYHCAASSSYKNIDGTGWIPVNFSGSQLKAPIDRLPVDPINTASTGNYFTYTTSGGTYELTASLESQKYATTTSIDGGQYTDLYETGSNLALAPTDYAGGSGGGHNGYSYARTITMSGSNVSGTLSNFPMLFSGTYAYLAASSSAGNVQNGNGYDIAFASDAGCNSKLNFEQESYTSSTGNIIDWVQVPSITGGAVIYLCYGNGSILSTQTNATATWDSNYAAVWHFPNGTILNASDSTSNANGGAITSFTAGTGQIDGGASNNSSNGKVSVADVAGLRPTAAITYEIWLNASTLGNSYPMTKEGSNTGYGMYTVTNNLHGYIRINGGWQDQIMQGSMSSATWYHAVVTYDGSTVRYYINGSQVLSTSISGSITEQSGVSLLLGNGPSLTEGWIGTIDEARLSTVARPSQWILTEYNNQSSPSTFYTVGAAM